MQRTPLTHTSEDRIKSCLRSCEGCEASALIPFLKGVCTDAVLVEVHFAQHAPGGVDPAQRMLRALNRTHVLYYAEPNPGAAGCIEFSLTRRHHAQHDACARMGMAQTRAGNAKTARAVLLSPRVARLNNSYGRGSRQVHSQS